MEKETIFQADVLDIIFEHRNKNYGAYALRKFYHNRLYKALGLVLLFVAVLAILSFFQKEKVLVGAIDYVDTTSLARPPKDPLPKKPKINEYHAPITATTVPTEGHALITKDSVNIKTIPTNSGMSTTAVYVNPGGTGDPGPGPVVVVTPATIPSIPPITPVDRSKPMESAEVMPEYPGGPQALRKFLEKNLRNPQNNETGENITVKIRFVVGFDGSLKRFEILRDGGAAFNDEVIRVLNKMPQWIPGKTKGESVSVYFTLPVLFTGAE